MTELAFHFGAPDKMAYTCRLLRKAVGSGAKVVVLATPDTAAQLDADLWALSPTEFVPHCVANARDAVRGRSPVVMVTDVQQAPDLADVLVNLTDTVAPGFERFARVIEVVSTDAADRDLARQRWRHYTERGYTIARHDLNLKRAD
ncbi:DNA polymerase III subunit chi [Rhodoferax sp. AJA081-3]|uniref:DNA polymerase III subunit chi n=1 Tax=Rhodoferax sp. AJA081-3 TaxID=2752316 RepID=UPI001AE06709|nr:DNA polymerase III subunit chi [Rhodoferax sp. AJA081-3]QTN28734.1 DNA polymerase III subunit chi [Rhodoferax sp. AJA081-3]